MKKKIWAVGVLLSLVGAIVIFTRKKDRIATHETVQSVTATRGTLEDAVECTGEVVPLNRVEIKPPIAGRVERLLAVEGDRVRAGDIVGWMSSTDRAAILDAARARGESERRTWEDTYKPTPIVAPLSGTIILRSAVVGQTVDGSTVLYALSDRLVVRADIDETDIGRVRVGLPAEITLDAYPDQPIAGRVFQVLQEGKNVSNVITYGAKIEPRETPAFFRSQMTANIRLVLERRENVVLLPTAAVRTGENGERTVSVVSARGRPEPRAVTVGRESGDQIEITDGVEAGETVLLSRRTYKPQRSTDKSPLVMGPPRASTGTASHRRSSTR
jgi:macrolide-specific efflux system membrane fusion protein